MRSSESNIKAIIEAIKTGFPSHVEDAVKKQSTPGVFGEWLTLKTPLTPLEGDMLMKAALEVKDTYRAVKILRILIDIGADPDHPGLQESPLRQALYEDLKEDLYHKQMDNIDRKTAWGLFKLIYTQTSEAEMDKLRILKHSFSPTRSDLGRAIGIETSRQKILAGAEELRGIKEHYDRMAEDFVHRAAPFMGALESITKVAIEFTEAINQKATHTQEARASSRVSNLEARRHKTSTPGSQGLYK